MTKNVPAKSALLDKTIALDGDIWTIVGVGNVNDEGATYCHLASTTRKRQQRNGNNPVQISDWISAEALSAVA